MGIDAEALERELGREIGTVPMRGVVRVGVHATLREVAPRFRAENVSAALVGEEPRAIVTERDLIHALADGADPDDPASEYVERTPLWITTTSQLSDGIKMMGHHDVRHLIVLDPEGEAVGVLSMRDFVTLVFAASTR